MKAHPAQLALFAPPAPPPAPPAKAAKTAKTAKPRRGGFDIIRRAHWDPPEAPRRAAPVRGAARKVTLRTLLARPLEELAEELAAALGRLEAEGRAAQDTHGATFHAIAVEAWSLWGADVLATTSAEDAAWLLVDSGRWTMAPRRCVEDGAACLFFSTAR